jgi:hypothetical protein
MEEWRHCMADTLELSDGKPEPSERLLLAASAIVIGNLDQFPDYRLDTLHFDRTIATSRLQSENFMGGVQVVQRAYVEATSESGNRYSVVIFRRLYPLQAAINPSLKIPRPASQPMSCLKLSRHLSSLEVIATL